MLSPELKMRAMAAVQCVRTVRVDDLARLYPEGVPMDVLAMSLADAAPVDDLVEALDSRLAALDAPLSPLREMLRVGAPLLAGMELVRRMAHRRNMGHPIRALEAADMLDVFAANDIRVDRERLHLHANLDDLDLRIGAHLLLIDHEEPSYVWTLCQVIELHPDRGEVVLSILAARGRLGPTRYIAPASMAIIVAPARASELVKVAKQRALVGAASDLINTPVATLKNARRRYRESREG